VLIWPRSLLQFTIVMPVSPKDYLEQLKQLEAMPYKGTAASVAFLEIHKHQEAQLKAAGINVERFLDEYFTAILGKIAASLPNVIQADIERRIAVGCIDHPSVNACIVRSDDADVFGILLNRALITMLNHYVKLVAAANFPSSVLYCNGLDVTKLSRKSYTQISTQMLKQYGQTGQPVGPELKIALETEAMAYIDANLTMSYVFILAHEIGHFVNGDLGTTGNFVSCSWVSNTSVFSPSPSHAMEYKADEFAFECVLRACNALPTRPASSQALFLSATTVFNFLREIENRGSESHPAPSDRLVHITEDFFGSPAASLMVQSFNNLALIEKLRALLDQKGIVQLLDARKAPST
jgi:hypothetical protein